MSHSLVNMIVRYPIKMKSAQSRHPARPRRHRVAFAVVFCAAPYINHHPLLKRQGDVFAVRANEMQRPRGMRTSACTPTVQGGHFNVILPLNPCDRLIVSSANMQIPIKDFDARCADGGSRLWRPVSGTKCLSSSYDHEGQGRLLQEYGCQSLPRALASPRQASTECNAPPVFANSRYDP